MIVLLCCLNVCFLDAYSNNKKDALINKDFENATLLKSVLEKLYQLEKNKQGKVNIVHIGDSHIQADMFTDAVRQNLQARFGNGGYGFTFPYSLAKTNGTSYIKYQSNVGWESRRNLYPVTDVSIGLSGIGLFTNNSDFEITMTVIPKYAFSKIRIVSPSNNNPFEINEPSNKDELLADEATVNRQSNVDIIPPKANEVEKKYHLVESGQTLYRISLQYNIPVEQIKSLNNLASNAIRVGMKLQIPTADSKEEQVVVGALQSEIVVTQKENSLGKMEYSFPYLVGTTTILLGRKQNQYNLSGIVIENNSPGVIYHSIGVNGAKVSDYNKYPLFFDQLSTLNPDLLIISLGTNEAFGKWTSLYYNLQMTRFVDSVRKQNPNVVILLMTAPPSLSKRKKIISLLDDYSDALKQMKGCVVWDLLKKMGGTSAPRSVEFSPLMARDKVHYTREGYEMQGELFSTDLMSLYNDYVKNRDNWIHY